MKLLHGEIMTFGYTFSCKKVRPFFKVIEKEWVCVVNFDRQLFGQKVSIIVLRFDSMGRFLSYKNSIWNKKYQNVKLPHWGIIIFGYTFFCKKSKTNFESYRAGMGMCSKF